MRSRKRTRPTADLLAAGLALALALSGCTLERRYIGSQLPTENMDGQIVVGTTTKAQVLAQIGAPDELLRQFDGDVFVYRYLRVNSSEFVVEEPVITNTELFTYKRVDEKSDRMVVLFDRSGVVSGVGVRMGTPELDQDDDEKPRPSAIGATSGGR
jgi:outer membrane protein assembly factor BamE (lipoprotein component of BamABCDE complex)